MDDRELYRMAKKAMGYSFSLVSQEGAVTPCGICRQFLYEFAPDLRVVWGSDEDHLTVTKLSALLPEGFRLER